MSDRFQPLTEGLEAWPRPRLDKPFKLTICVTQTCHMDCQLCYADCTNDPARELTTAQWKRFIDELAAENFLHIFFEGGEPFDRPDFEELLGHVNKRLYVAVRTHATGLDSARARRLKALGVGRIYVDLYSAEPHVQDQLTSRDGSYERAVAGIRSAREAGISVTILAILSRRNYKNLEAYFTLAEALDADQVGVLRLYPLGRAKRNWSTLSLSLDQMMSALNGLRVPRSVQLMQSWHPRDGNCCWQNAAVSPSGQSIGCPYLREYVDFGNITTMPIVETWDHPLYRQLRDGEVEETCVECSSTQGTLGGCRSTAYAFHGRFTASDPYCLHNNQGVNLHDLPQRLLRKDV